MSNDKHIKNPFRVPENYFVEVNRKILDSTVNAKPDSKMKSLHRFRLVLAMAASVAVLLIMGFLATTYLNKKKAGTELSQVLELSPDVFIEDLDLFTLEENVEIYASAADEAGLSEDEIIEYLISDNIDISEIYEKL